MENNKMHLKFSDFEWEGVPKTDYKKVDSKGPITFNNVSRQNIITSKDGVNFEVRYFECEKDGFTTLEKHGHVHIVMVIRGHGKVIIKDKIYDAKKFDYFVIPSWAEHQLINTGSTPFGFCCSVNADRDKYTLLSKQEVENLKGKKDIAKYIKVPADYFSN